MKVAVKHIRHYNHLNGKEITRKQLERVHTALKKDLDKKRIDTTTPMGKVCVTIEERIRTAIGKMNGKPMRITLKVVDLSSLQQKNLPVVKRVKDAPISKPSLKAPLQGPSDVFVPPVQHAVKFKTIDLDGQYKKDFFKLYNDTQIMIWGLPGSGKTFYLMKLAKYMAEKLKLPVVYVAAEEYGRSTFDEKISEIFGVTGVDKFNHPNLVFVKSIDQLSRMGKNIDQFRVAFFDSVNKMKWSVDDWTVFADQHPGMIKIAIIQTTKDGDFKGGQEWQHEVDVAAEIRNRNLIVRKNRLDPDFATKRDKLLLEDKILQRQEKQTIQEKVKQRIAPLQGVPLASYKPETTV